MEFNASILGTYVGREIAISLGTAEGVCFEMEDSISQRVKRRSLVKQSVQDFAQFAILWDQADSFKSRETLAEISGADMALWHKWANAVHPPKPKPQAQPTKKGEGE